MGFTITDSMASTLKSDYFFYENGKFYSPAADGESYTGLSILTKVEELGDDRLKICFNDYSQSLETYWDQKDKDYSQTDEEASKSPDYMYCNSGYAIVKVKGSSYILEHREEYPVESGQ